MGFRNLGIGDGWMDWGWMDEFLWNWGIEGFRNLGIEEYYES